MKRLILSLAAIFIMFFLAENAKAQPIPTSCDTFYTSPNNYAAFTLENGCTGYVLYCCRYMEIGYEIQAAITRIVFDNVDDCGSAPAIDDASYWSAVNEAIAANGCGGQSMNILPCKDKPTSVTLSISRTACVMITYDYPSSQLNYSFGACDKKEGGYSYNKYGICFDIKTQKNKLTPISSEFVEGDCHTWDKTVQQLIDEKQNYYPSECYSLPCSQ